MLSYLPALSNVTAIYPLCKSQTPVQFGLLAGFVVGSFLVDLKLVDKNLLSVTQGLCYSSILAYAIYKLDSDTPVNFRVFFVLSNAFYSLSTYDLVDRTRACMKFSTDCDEDGAWFAINRSLFQVCAYSLLATVF